MANLNISWVLPTTKVNGRALPVDQIAYARIELSADAGVNYVLLGDFQPDVLSTVVQDIDFGTWTVRGLVADVNGRLSAPVVREILNEDTSPPGTLSLTLELA